MTTLDFSNQLGLSISELIKVTIDRNEGVLSNGKALVVSTGKRTGRSPKDRYIVKDQHHAPATYH